MGARASDGAAERVVPGHQRSLAKEHLTGRSHRIDVQADDRGDVVHGTVGDHPLRATQVLLVRLLF